MRRFTALVVLAVLLSACASASTPVPLSDEIAVRKLDQEAGDAFIRREWVAIYTQLSPASREICTYADFAAVMLFAQTLLGLPEGTEGVEYRIATVLIEDDLAWVSSDLYYEGEPLGFAETDDQPSYQKTDGKWHPYEEEPGEICNLFTGP